MHELKTKLRRRARPASPPHERRECRRAVGERLASRHDPSGASRLPAARIPRDQPSHNNRRLFTPPHELELVQLRSALARLQGEQMIERTVARAGQIDEILYKMKVASQKYN